MKMQTLQNTIRTDDATLTVLTGQARAMWDYRMNCLAQWCSSRGAPALVDHAARTLTIYKDSVGKSFRSPTFNDVHEHVLGERYILEDA